MNLITKIRSVNSIGSPSSIVVLCPACHREGNFTPLGQDLILQAPTPNSNSVRTVAVGHRQCPNLECRTHVFVVYQPSQPPRIESTYPVGRIDFDSTGVPEKICKTFDEALTCAANDCYVASGMLIRKTLEALCDDREAQGGDLKARIKDLKSRVTLPGELFEAMDHLRLLGNDAAHIEAKTYDSVGRDEVLAGVELAKEIIKATYQYKSLLGKLLALKKS